MEAAEHKETDEKTHIYEMSYLIVPAVAEAEMVREVASIRSALETAGAVIIAEDYPKLRPLAYTMERTIESKKQKFSTGYFGWTKFELPAAFISNIKQAIEKRPNIIRHLIVKTVRENTLYSNRPPTVSSKNDGKSEEETRPENQQAENKTVSGKEIDKSIDALVIN